jgi:mono/diheme cytochrome c family protein
VYAKKCKSCHGASGAADTKIGEKNDIPSWKEPGWKAKWPQSKVVDIVTNGKAGTKMKPFKDKLSKEEIDAVSAYSRSLGS